MKWHLILAILSIVFIFGCTEILDTNQLVNPFSNEPVNITKSEPVIIVRTEPRQPLNCNKVEYNVIYQCGELTSTNPEISCRGYETERIETCNMPNEWVCAKGKNLSLIHISEPTRPY